MKISFIESKGVNYVMTLFKMYPILPELPNDIHFAIIQHLTLCDLSAYSRTNKTNRKNVNQIPGLSILGS